jgi:DNA helicase IV
MPQLTLSIPFFNRFFGRVRGAGVVVLSNDEVSIGSLVVRHDTEGSWESGPCFFWSKIRLTSDPAVRFLLQKRDAGSFTALANAHRTRHANRHLIDVAGQRLDRWEAMLSADRYLPRHEVAEWLAGATDVRTALFPSLRELATVLPTCPSVRLSQLTVDPFRVAATRNAQFVAREQTRRNAWFSSFEQPPTTTQREVAIRDETNVLVVAGAGTGKTSAIVAKLRYLLHAGLARPEDILVLAFNANAAEEIRERCKAQGGDGATILTFHALGLKILADAPGEKPPVLTELSTDESRFSLIKKLIASLSEEPTYAENYAKFVFLYARPLVDRFSVTEVQYVTRTKSAITASLSGDWVRSSEELRIANWLFAHEILFSYEKAYPFDTSGAGKTSYRPDFTITYSKTDSAGVMTEVQIYFEHQALNQQGQPPSWMTGYAAKVEWSRATHRRHRTTLVESFSWWFQTGSWETRLRSALEKAGITVPKVDWQARLRGAELAESRRFESDRKNILGLMQRALDLSRCTVDVATHERALADSLAHSSKSAAAQAYDASREALFDELFRPVQRAYEDHKRERAGIDFEDMIYCARQVVRAGAYRAKWSYYIVDEFQDASLSRLDLVLALREQRPDSRLLCIGDDWQAIIRFGGGDIRVMTQFAQRVGPFWQANLGQTFRYSSTIADVSSEFITANPDQLKKTISPASGSRSLPIRIILSALPETGGEGHFNDVLFAELEAIQLFKPDASVLLLSRYRSGIPEISEQKTISARFPGLGLIWSTMHRSKGQEADAVIVGDLNDDAFGFPCLREDDPIIRRYLPPEDRYEHAEERRLFYVAMTRAKHWLALLASSYAPSPFLRELIERRGSRPGLEVVHSGEPAKSCPRCGVGFLIPRDGTNGRFYTCTKSPVCGHKEQACPVCRQGFLIVEGDRIVCSRKKARSCTHEARLCPRCRTGWLVVRVNRHKGNRFWGCSRFSDTEDQCRHTEKA